MKQLILIEVCGIAVVLLLAFSANAWFGMSHGHPTAYATWLQDMVLRHPWGAVLVVVFLLTFWAWNPDNPEDRHGWRQNWWDDWWGWL